MKGIFLIALLCVSGALGHTLLTNLTIDGRITSECLRPTMNWDGMTAPDFPIMGGTFPNGAIGINYTCGWTDGTKSGAALPSKKVCEIAAGSKVTTSWWHGARTGEDAKVDDFIHNSHHGPFIVYMAKWDQDGGLPTGPAWFKVYELGVTKDNKDFWLMEWASPHVLNQNGGALDFTVPSQLAPGRYLMRFEILALHDTIKQPYVRCADVSITGTGNIQPMALISIPGSIPLNDPGFTYNMYEQTNRPKYPIPGPRPFNFEGSVSDLPCDSKNVTVTCPSGSTCAGTCQCDNGSIGEGYTCDASSLAMSTLLILALFFTFF